jgi:hypothetical protein
MENNVLFIFLDLFTSVIGRNKTQVQELIFDIASQDKINSTILILQNQKFDYNLINEEFTDKSGNPVVWTCYINNYELGVYQLIKKVLLENIDVIEATYDHIVILDSHIRMTNSDNYLAVYNLLKELDESNKDILIPNYDADVHGLCLETFLSCILFKTNAFIDSFEKIPEDFDNHLDIINILKNVIIPNASIKMINSYEKWEFSINQCNSFHNIFFRTCLDKIYKPKKRILYDEDNKLDPKKNQYPYYDRIIFQFPEKYEEMLIYYPYQFASIINRYKLLDDTRIDELTNKYDIQLKIDDNIHNIYGVGIINID